MHIDVICITLKGEKGPDGHTRTYWAYDSFIRQITDKYSHLFYIDDDGVPVFLLSFIMVGNAHTSYAERWYDACALYSVVNPTCSVNLIKFPY